jgi:serine/threonine-protein kinase
MGTVLEAEHRALGKRVVVKLLHPELAREKAHVERLRREARALARVASPYLVAVSDLGETADGSTFLVMERLEGCTLGRELKLRGALPVPEAIRWTRQVLLGLAAAHRAGIIHRDVKLENIFLCDATEQEARRIKLLDFGIAKVLKSGIDSSGAHQATVEGTVIGSPRWLAPEQAAGEPVDARTDIYSAGLVLYSLVVGRGPYAHLDPIAAMGAALTEQPRPPSQVAPQHIPPALEEVIMMAVEKAPALRFQSAEAFAAALDSIAGALGDVTQPLPAGFVLPPRVANDRGAQEKDSEPRESTAPTVQRPLPPAASSSPGASPWAQPDALEDTLADPPTEPRRAMAVFVGLALASAALVMTLLILAMRAAGRW